MFSLFRFLIPLFSRFVALSRDSFHRLTLASISDHYFSNTVLLNVLSATSFPSFLAWLEKSYWEIVLYKANAIQITSHKNPVAP